MLKSKTLIGVAIAVAIFLLACSGGDKSGKKVSMMDNTVSGNEDTLTNDLQCKISIDGKEFTIPADSIHPGFVRQDSSYSIGFTGINGGGMTISIPHLFKCPCKIPAGFTGERYKISFSDDYATHPTVILSNYPVKGMYVHSSSDGQHEIALASQKENAVEILSVEKISENHGVNSADFLIKGKIHVILLKNLNHEDAGVDNKDYEVNGSFVIKDKIYF
jgi:hypothetical protein